MNGNGYLVSLHENGIVNPLKRFPTIDEAVRWMAHVRRSFPDATIEITNANGELLVVDDNDQTS